MYTVHKNVGCLHSFQIPVQAAPLCPLTLRSQAPKRPLVACGVGAIFPAPAVLMRHWKDH